MSIDTQNKLLDGAGLQKAFELLKTRLSSGYVAKTTVVPNLTTGVNIGSIDGKEFYAPMAGEAPDLSGYVPSSRTVNGQALTTNIILTASDVGVQFTPTLTEGTTIGALTLDGTTTTLYAPNPITSLDWSQITNAPSIPSASVAFSGDYDDLTNTPVDVSYFVNDRGYITASDISYTAAQTTGITLGYLDVTSANGSTNSYSIYAPSVTVTQTLVSGTEIGSVNGTTLYAPAPPQNNIQVYEISYDSQQSKYVLGNGISYNDIDHDVTYNNIPILRMTGSGLNEMFYLSGHTASTIYFRNISLQNMTEIAISESGQDTVINVTNLGINVNGITIVIPADTHTAIN